MISLLSQSLLCVWIFLSALANAQSASSSGYVGYNLTLEGDEDSVTFATANTELGADENAPDPDVYLNATGEIQRLLIIGLYD